MKKATLIITSIILLTAFVNKRSNKDFKRLYALEGTWQMSTRRGMLCEEWKKVNDDYLQSKGYLIRGSDTLISERVALTNKGDEIFYTSTVENQNNREPVAFKMTKVDNNSFIFENPAHDFPKRIVYELATADSLHAYIDDGVDRSGRQQHFYYKRLQK